MAYRVTISFSDYRFTSVLGKEQLEDAVTKLIHRVFQLNEQEELFFDLPHFLSEVNELAKEESICFQVSKSRPFTLNVKRVV